MDGDKISTLFAKFLSKQLELAHLEHSLKIGVVQTAYANGSSTAYIKNTLHCPVSCTKTGVKHLHHEAATQYDIGIYFEANGHGTIIFSEKFHRTIKSELSKSKLNGDTLALRTLKCFSELINQTVGDAISDMLAVLATLADFENVSQWIGMKSILICPTSWLSASFLIGQFSKPRTRKENCSTSGVAGQDRSCGSQVSHGKKLCQSQWYGGCGEGLCGM